MQALIIISSKTLTTIAAANVEVIWQVNCCADVGVTDSSSSQTQVYRSV